MCQKLHLEINPKAIVTYGTTCFDHAMTRNYRSYQVGGHCSTCGSNSKWSTGLCGQVRITNYLSGFYFPERGPYILREFTTRLTNFEGFKSIKVTVYPSLNN